MQGLVKTLTDKGFGFIRGEGETKDVFFHKSGLESAEFDDLREGDRVEYEVVESEKGPKAIGVRLV